MSNDQLKPEPHEGDLKVWWNCNFGNPHFAHAVKSPEEAVLILDSLGSYDEYVHEQVYLNPEYSNNGGLLVYRADEGGWVDWESPEGLSIDDFVFQQKELKEETLADGLGEEHLFTVSGGFDINQDFTPILAVNRDTVGFEIPGGR